MSAKIIALLATVGGLTLASASAWGATYVKDAPPLAQAPSVADIAAVYPARAKAEGAGGKVRLACSVGHDNRPRDCSVLTETGHYGFGAAAEKLAEKMKVEADGMYGQNIFIPFTFDPSVLSGAATVAKPAWVDLPSAQDFQATFPKTENGVNHVRVVLGCTVAADGSLDGCAVNQEDPAGQGYGAGALALASKFRLATWGPEGEPMVGAKINLPIRYELTPAAK
jgi:TonB family protein